MVKINRRLFFLFYSIRNREQGDNEQGKENRKNITPQWGSRGHTYRKTKQMSDVYTISNINDASTPMCVSMSQYNVGSRLRGVYPYIYIIIVWYNTSHDSNRNPIQVHKHVLAHILLKIHE